jgi:streptomycin 6-kinase
MMAIPSAFADATVRREGAGGVRWLNELPSLIDRFVREWDCEIVGDAGHGAVAIVVPVERAAAAAVLKISFPHRGNRGEASALRHLDGRGAVRLLDADESAFALLLERAGPQTLAALPSAEEAIETAGRLARRLAVPAPAGTQSLADTTQAWQEQLDQQTRAAPELLSAQVIARARETIRFLGSDATSTMLHGDLHFRNILRAAREPWLAIDPKGWRGSAAFDAFTVIAERPDQLRHSADPSRAIRDRVRRYALAADVNADLALACSQARATSSYLHQHLAKGDWFDVDFLRCLATIIV